MIQNPMGNLLFVPRKLGTDEALMYVEPLLFDPKILSDLVGSYTSAYCITYILLLNNEIKKRNMLSMEDFKHRASP